MKVRHQTRRDMHQFLFALLANSLLVQSTNAQSVEDKEIIMSVSLPEALENVARCYDLDGDDILKWEELVCFIVSFLRKNDPGCVGFWRSLARNDENVSKYAITDVVAEGYQTSCSIPIAGVVKLLLDLRSEENGEDVRLGLVTHGYLPGDGENWKRTPEADEVNGDWSFTYQRAALSKDSMWSMTVGNAMHHFMVLPTDECLRAIENGGGDPHRGMWEDRRQKWRTQRILCKIRSLPEDKRRDSLSVALLRVFSRYDADEDDMLNGREVVALFASALSDPYSSPLSDAEKLFGSPPFSKDSFVKAVEEEKNIEAIVGLLLRMNFKEDMKWDMPDEKVSLSALILSWKDLCLSTNLNEGECVFAFRGACAVVSLALSNTWLVSPDDMKNLECITRLHGLSDYWKVREEISSDEKGFLARASNDVDVAWGAVSLLVRLHLGLCKNERGSSMLDLVRVIDEAALAHADEIATRLVDGVEEFANARDPDDLMSKLRGQRRGGRDDTCVKYVSRFGLEREAQNACVRANKSNDQQGQPLMYRTLGKADLSTVALFLAKAAQLCSCDSFTNTLAGVLERMAKGKGQSFQQAAQEVAKSELGGLAPEAWLMVAALSTRALPPIVLPSDAEIIAGGGDFVVLTLCSHLGLKSDGREKLNSWFHRSGFIGQDEDLADVICRDTAVLAKLGVDRFAVAEKMEQVLDIRILSDLKRTVEQLKEAPYAREEQIAKAELDAKNKAKAAAASLELDEDELYRNGSGVPWVVGICSTMGHHGDAFYPFGSMSSYYLGVGGSCDCVIVNKQLSADGDGKALEVASWENFLAARLNAKKRPEWEDWDGVLYLSDMQPYLTRQGLFQGLKSRYRVDPERAVKILRVKEAS